MAYKVEIKKLVKAVNSHYDREEEVYTQIVENIDILAIINAVNPPERPAGEAR